MSNICRVGVTDEYIDLINGYSIFDPSKYSEKLKETLAIEGFEERILSLHELYLNYENESSPLYCYIPFDNSECNISDDVEEKKDKIRLINSEMKVIVQNISSMLEKYNEISFPCDEPIANVSYLIRKKLISKHV